MLEIFLVLLSAFLVGRVMKLSEPWLLAYVLFVWWTGFYAARINHHFTLLPSIWGFQFILWAGLTIRWRELHSVLLRAFIMGLVFAGTFHNTAMLSLPLLAILTLRLWQDRAQQKSLAWVKTLGLATVIFLGTFVFFFAPAIISYFQSGQPHSVVERTHFSLALLHAFLPLWAGGMALPIEATNPLDLVILGIVLVSLLHKKFWQEPLRRVLILLAAFCFVWSLGPELRMGSSLPGEGSLENYFFTLLERIPPLSVSRAPGRFMVVTALSFIYLAFDYLRLFWMERAGNFKVALALIAWILVTGPVLTHEIFVPTWDYKSNIPQKAVEVIRASSVKTIVAHIPTAMAADPLQNFFQLFHQKRISAGYLAYTAYTSETMKTLLEDPFLSHTNCFGDALVFKRTSFLENFEVLHEHLKKTHIGFLVLNKNILNDAACSDLVNWLRELVKQPWVQVLDETPVLLVFDVR
jgi:hypothetical protein